MSDQGTGNDETGATGAGAKPTKPAEKMRLVTSGDILDAANDVLKNSLSATTAAAAATTPSPSPPPATPCCDAYPAEALSAALAMPTDPKDIPKDLTDDQRGRLLALDQQIVDARVELLKKSAWAIAPEMVLLEACPEDDRAQLAKSMLIARSAIADTDYERREAETEVEEERAESARVAREILEVGKTQMEKWTTLADKGKEMLVATTAFSAVLIVITLIFASEGKLDGTETPIIIFILAIFAISPAVLLLLERPLEGLDKFTPSGPTGGDSGSTTDASGEAAAK